MSEDQGFLDDVPEDGQAYEDEALAGQEPQDDFYDDEPITDDDVDETPQPQPERPAWLPEGYESPEQLVSAFQERDRIYSKAIQLYQQNPHFREAWHGNVQHQQAAGQAQQPQQSIFWQPGDPNAEVKAAAAAQMYATNPVGYMQQAIREAGTPVIHELVQRVVQPLHAEIQRLKAEQAIAPLRAEIAALPSQWQQLIQRGVPPQEVLNLFKAQQQAKPQVQKQQQAQQRLNGPTRSRKTSPPTGKAKTPEQAFRRAYEKAKQRIK